MNSDQADRILALIVPMTYGWTDERAVLWHQHLTGLDSFDAAAEAARSLIENYTEMAAPPWGTFLDTYRAERRRLHPVEPPALNARRVSLRQAVAAWERDAPWDAEARRLLRIVESSPQAQRWLAEDPKSSAGTPVASVQPRTRPAAPQSAPPSSPPPERPPDASLSEAIGMTRRRMEESQ